MHEPAVAIRSLAVDYGRQRALDGLDLEVPSSGVFGLLGRNGAGKTTTIRAIAGLVKPAAGTVSVLGTDPASDPSVRKLLSILLSDDGLVAGISVRENLVCWALVNGCTIRQARPLAGEALRRVSSPPPGGKLVRDLSTGARRTVALARSFMLDRPLVILDEPTASLDPVASAECRDLIRHLSADRPVLLSTHNLSEAAELCRQVAIIHLGKVVFDGPPIPHDQVGAYLVKVEDGRLSWEGRPLAADETGQFTVTTQMPPADALSALVASGARVTEFRPLRRSLSDVFLELAG